MPSLLTIDDLDLPGKTVFVRVDINTPIDPATGKLMELNRIHEAAVSVRDLSSSKVVVASHQGRVGRYDYIPLDQHAAALESVLDREVKYVDDVFGPKAREEIKNLGNGDVLLLDNLRFVAEENMEFAPEAASKTIFVQRLYRSFDACVLDAFPTAHRAHPSVVGFSYLLPTAGGRLVVKEIKTLTRIMTVAKGPFTAVLGGAKVSDRLEAIDTLIVNERADKVLVTGLLGTVFLKARGQVKGTIGIEEEEKHVAKATELCKQYPETFELPEDVAVLNDGERKEIPISEVKDCSKIRDVGSRTVDKYSRIIRSSGTAFMSGPPGMFEKDEFSNGTERLLRAMAASLATTIVSGGHLSAALERFAIRDWIDHVSTSGGALIQYLAGKRLPLIEALERSSARFAK